ncbi:class I SAM-dependent methyltransferase, partial [Pseudomonas aeruginosa]
ASGGRIYLREPVAVEQRLTLDRFFSKELEHEYSAVYRTVAELKDMLVQAGGGEGPAILEEDCLFAEALEKRVETRQYFMILQRRG